MTASQELQGQTRNMALLIDGDNALLHAYHATSGWTTSKGVGQVAGSSHCLEHGKGWHAWRRRAVHPRQCVPAFDTFIASYRRVNQAYCSRGKPISGGVNVDEFCCFLNRTARSDRRRDCFGFVL